MELNLRNALIFFDLETTGTSYIKDRIVEISYYKLMPNGSHIEDTIRVNPEMHIPAEATAVHGISDADVANAPTFKMIAKELAKVFEGCDIAGFNSNKFDIPLLAEEFLRAGEQNVDFSNRKFIDVQTIYHKMEPRTLSAAYKFYCHKDLADAHTASADTKATYEVLKAQLDRYPSLQNDVAFLSDFSSHNRNVDLAGRFIYNEQGVEVFNFGKYKGVAVEEVLRRDTGYYGWMMNGDFALDTKRALTRIKLRLR